MSAPIVHPHTRLLSITQAAAEFGIGATTLKTLMRDRVVPVVRVPGIRKNFLDRRDLEKLVESWKVKAS